MEHRTVPTGFKAANDYDKFHLFMHQMINSESRAQRIAITELFMTGEYMRQDKEGNIIEKITDRSLKMQTKQGINAVQGLNKFLDVTKVTSFSQYLRQSQYKDLVMVQPAIYKKAERVFPEHEKDVEMRASERIKADSKIYSNGQLHPAIAEMTSEGKWQLKEELNQTFLSNMMMLSAVQNEQIRQLNQSLEKLKTITMNLVNYLKQTVGLEKEEVKQIMNADVSKQKNQEHAQTHLLNMDVGKDRNIDDELRF